MASRGVNKVILIGNLGQDPEVRYMPNGGAVANLTLATSDSWRDKQTGEQKERTEWHRVALYGKLAEIAGEYLRKGSQVYIEGQLRTRKWQDQGGQDRYTTEVVVDISGACRCWVAAQAAALRPAAAWATTRAAIRSKAVGVSRNSRSKLTSSAAAVSPVRSKAHRCRATSRRWILMTTFRSDKRHQCRGRHRFRHYVQVQG